MMKAVALAALATVVNAHGNMLYPYAWWDANGTGAKTSLAPFCAAF